MPLPSLLDPRLSDPTVPDVPDTSDDHLGDGYDQPVNETLAQDDLPDTPLDDMDLEDAYDQLLLIRDELLDVRERYLDMRSVVVTKVRHDGGVTRLADGTKLRVTHAGDLSAWPGRLDL